MNAKRMIGLLTLMLVMLCAAGCAQESTCEHSIWAMDCIGIKTYCPECQDSAKLTGTETCSSCSGRGKVTCYSCNGKGRKTCSYCYGTGKRMGRECNYCGGKRALGCLNCLASGSEYCSSCKGTGKDILLSNECMRCGSTPQCCEYYAFHSFECPVCSPDAYAKFEYKNMIRNEKQYVGNPCQVSGVVESVSKIDDKDTYELRIKRTSLFTKEYYNILYLKTDLSPTLLAGDKVTLFGVFTGVNNEMEPLLVAAHAVLNK